MQQLHRHTVPASFRPSEYTAALLQVLLANSPAVRGAHVLEIGCGSGVLLAALAEGGAASICGIDVESEAVDASTMLLDQLGHGGKSDVRRGSLWEPVAGRRFDLIAANLPHFPMRPLSFGGRSPSWGYGGVDGRMLLDPFVAGLAGHLAPGGRAYITHNAFVSLDRSRAMLEQDGLSMSVANTAMVYIPVEKLELMTDGILDRERGRTMWQYGAYVFAEMHVVEIKMKSGTA